MKMSYFCCYSFHNNSKQNKKMAEFAMEAVEEVQEIEKDLIPCHVCGRTFLATPLKTHIKVCEKNAIKKRKTFDSLKQRVEGTELAVFHQKSYLKKPEIQCSSETKFTEKNQTNWKEKHQELVDTIRAAKSNKSPPPSAMGPRRSISASGTMGHTSRCPSCDRQFGPKAFDRHVEWCREHKTRQMKSPTTVNLAKERLEARTKYRAPSLGKSKRIATKEKYSGKGSQTGLDGGNLSRKSSVELDREGNWRDKVKETKIIEPIIKKVEKADNKNEKQKSAAIKADYDPFVIAEKQLQELLHCDDNKPKPKSSSINTTTKTKNTPVKNIQKRASVIEPPKDFEDKDNFELIENFINDNFDKNKKVNNNDSLNLNAILSHRKYSDDQSAIDPRLINEIDNLDIPHKLFNDNSSPMSPRNDVDHYSQQYDKNISLLEPKTCNKQSKIQNNDQTLTDIDFEELISSFDDDDSFPTLKTFLQTNKTEKVTKKSTQKSTLSLNSSFGRSTEPKSEKKILTPLKRSISLSNPITKARSMKCKQDITDYLHVKDPKRVAVLPNKKILTPKSSEELFPETHELYDEYKKFEEEYKKEMGGIDVGDYSSNDESRAPPNSAVRKIDKGKFCGDSAYGSLNRKSPKVQTKLPNRIPPQRGISLERSPSSSGSETMVPAPMKVLPKFCHECGTKFPLDTAKFCVECGLKRLIL